MELFKFILVCSIIFFFTENASASFSVCIKQDSFPNPIKTMEKRRAIMQQTDSASLTLDQYETLIGRKLLPFEKRRFEKMQEQREAYVKKHGRYKFNLGGFFLGLLLGPFGVAGAYVFSKNRDLRISSWFGLIGCVIIASVVVTIAI